MSNNIYPTHQCFDDAIEYICEVAKLSKDDASKLILVHAVCYAESLGDYAHAWIEDNEACIFKGIYNGEVSWFMADKSEYYKELNVKNSTRYTLDQILSESRVSDSSGPWKDEYKKLCRDTKQTSN